MSDYVRQQRITRVGKGVIFSQMELFQPPSRLYHCFPRKTRLTAVLPLKNE